MSTSTCPGTPDVLTIDEAPGVFADALLRDERGSLLFCSLWGRDTAIQELLARLSVSEEEGGVRSLRFGTAESAQTAHFDRMPSIEKLTARLPPQNLFGAMVQLWLFDRLAIEPDRANRRALLLKRGVDRSDAVLWSLVRTVVHIPLLDHWKTNVLDVFEHRGWITRIDGFHVDGLYVDLGSPEVELAVSELVRNCTLRVDGALTA